MRSSEYVFFGDEEFQRLPPTAVSYIDPADLEKLADLAAREETQEANIKTMRADWAAENERIKAERAAGNPLRLPERFRVDRVNFHTIAAPTYDSIRRTLWGHRSQIRKELHTEIMQHIADMRAWIIDRFADHPTLETPHIDLTNINHAARTLGMFHDTETPENLGHTQPRTISKPEIYAIATGTQTLGAVLTTPDPTRINHHPTYEAITNPITWT